MSMIPLLSTSTLFNPFPSICTTLTCFPILQFPHMRGMRSLPTGNPPQAAPPVHSDVEYCDDMSCIICYEDMELLDSVRLECGHRFHTEVKQCSISLSIFNFGFSVHPFMVERAKHLSNMS